MVPAASPRLQLETLFVLNGVGRIVSTREPQPTPGPAFILIRGASACAWGIRRDVPDHVAEELDQLAAQEPALGSSWRQPPLHAERYRGMLGGSRVRSGPAFEFPDWFRTPAPASAPDDGVMSVDDEARLARHFSGWVAGEISAGRSPVMAVAEDAHPVSVCFSARRSAVAAEAGVETAAAFRGRGHAPRVTAAWANAVRGIGLVPLYSTDWENGPSLAVARKLELIPFAIDWSIE